MYLDTFLTLAKVLLSQVFSILMNEHFSLATQLLSPKNHPQFIFILNMSYLVILSHTLLDFPIF